MTARPRHLGGKGCGVLIGVKRFKDPSFQVGTRFDVPLQARFLRFVMESWHGHGSMRVGRELCAGTMQYRHYHRKVPYWPCRCSRL